MHFILFYDYEGDIVERRAPFRETHMALVQNYVDRGSLILAGPFVDPLDGAALIFTGNDRSEVEAFVENDPYVANSLVREWRIRSWNVVAGMNL